VRFLYVALVSTSLLLGLSFVIPYGLPWRSDNPSMAWLQSGLGWVAIAFDTAVLLSLLNVVVPWWAVLLILLAQDVVFAWRRIVLVRTRRRRSK